MVNSKVLSQAALFQGIPLNGLSHLAEQGSERGFPAGSVLVRQGEPSDTMYVIVAGKVRVERSHPHLSEAVVLAELGPGEVVGEMGVLDDEPRSATVIAEKDTVAFELGAQALSESMVRYPEISRALLRMLSKRLRNTDELVGQMLRRRRHQLVGELDVPSAEERIQSIRESDK